MTTSTIDTTAIATAHVEQLESSWNAADGAAFGAVFADDADFVDVRGDHHTGRHAIAHGHQGIFDSIYAGSTVRYELDVARAVAPGSIVAIINGTLDAPSGPLQGVNHCTITAVL